MSTVPTTTFLLEQQSNIMLQVLGCLQRMEQASISDRQAKSQALQQWKKQNPELHSKCQKAYAVLNTTHAELVDRIADTVIDDTEVMESDWGLREFLSSNANNLQILNQAVHTFSQLGSP